MKVLDMELLENQLIIIKDFTYDIKQDTISYLINTFLHILEKRNKIRIIVIETK